MKKFKYTTFLLFISLLAGCGNTLSQNCISSSQNFTNSSCNSLHTHTYSDKMVYDENHHWYEVTCEHDDAANKEAHIFESLVTEPTGHSGGYTTYSCEKCGYSYTGNETDPLTYTIIWKNYDGSTLETDENVEYGSTPSYDGSTPTKLDDLQYTYTWSGWTPSIESVTSDAIYVATFSDTLVKAKISFDLNGGTTAHSTEPFYSPTIDSEFFFFDVKKEDYNFRGWSYNGEMVFDHKGNKLTNPSIVESMTFKAEFAQNVILTIHSNIPSAGEYHGGGTYEYNTYVDVSAHPNQGYSFVGWYNNNNLLSKQERYKYMMWSEDVTLEARFRVNSYSLHVESEQPLLGQVMIKGDKSYEDYSNHSASYLDSITISAYTKTDEYRFLGWYDSDGVLVTPSAVYSFLMTNYDYDLYARWDSPSHNLIVTSNNKSDCTITGGGSYKYGSYVTVDINYSYGTFEGWYDSNGNLMSTKTSYIFIMPNNELHLEAKWIKDLIVQNGVINNCNSNLDSITIPDSVTSIGNYAFYNCRSLTSIVIPDSVTSIGESAFEGCTSLTSIVIPDSVTSIGEGAFEDCDSLTSITLPFAPSFLGYIFGASSYHHNDDYVPTSLKEVIITGGTSISSYAFYFCSSLTSIVIPNSVISIGDYAFCYCSSLTSIVIPDSVTSIRSGAFLQCSFLTNVYYSGTIEEWCNLTFSSYDSNPMSCASHFFMLDEKNDWYEVTKIEIPFTITSICDYQFYDFDNITDIIIPNSVTSIGRSAFSGCSSLTSIVIPNSVTSIVDYSFDDCDSLTIYCEIESIQDGWDSFWNSGRPVYWGINENNFIENDGIQYVIVKAEASITRYVGNNSEVIIPSTIKMNGITYNVTSIGRSAFSGCSSLTSIVIPNSVTSIADYSFDDCSSLVSIVIPDSVTSIGYYAFAYCSSLASIVIPDSVTSIESGAFYNCSSLTSIVIPNSVTSIGRGAFRGCSSLTSIVIPNSVTSIGRGAFDDCDSLTIYCEIEYVPYNWEEDWNGNRPVYWGYKII